jgi:putative oxidoreductase
MPLDHPSVAARDTTAPTGPLAEWRPRMLSVLRIVAALLFLLHGTQKMFGFPPPSEGGLPELLTLSWFSGALELVLGALLLVGLFTRVSAFIASGEMAFAYFLAHAPRHLFPTVNGGDAAILYCFVFLYLAFAGAGPWSLDALRKRRAGSAVT